MKKTLNQIMMQTKLNLSFLFLNFSVYFNFSLYMSFLLSFNLMDSFFSFLPEFFFSYLMDSFSFGELKVTFLFNEDLSCLFSMPAKATDLKKNKSEYTIFSEKTRELGLKKRKDGTLEPIQPNFLTQKKTNAVKSKASKIEAKVEAAPVFKFKAKLLPPTVEITADAKPLVDAAQQVEKTEDI